MALLWMYVFLAGIGWAQSSPLPSAFPEFPNTIRTDLENRHCKIPQLAHNPGFKSKENVITGHFAKARQTDWA
jgi:hypothetical protein